jgi:hypothetical protein
MKALKSAGTAQNRKIYARHGVLEPMFGVSTANLTKIKKDALRLPGPRPRYEKHAHELALELWESGNHDARAGHDAGRSGTDDEHPARSVDARMRQPWNRGRRGRPDGPHSLRAVQDEEVEKEPAGTDGGRGLESAR